MLGGVLTQRGHCNPFHDKSLKHSQQLLSRAMLTSRNSVLGLPVDIIIAILTTWLQALDVARLDCACYARLPLLNSLLDSPRLSNVPKSGNIRLFLKWICEKGVHINELYIFGGCDLVAISQYAEKFGHQIRRLRLVCLPDKQGLERVLQNCTNLTFLCLDSLVLTESLVQCLHGCTVLQELHAIQLRCLHNDALFNNNRQIANHLVLGSCRKLKALVVDIPDGDYRQAFIKLCSLCPIEYLKVNIYRIGECEQYLRNWTHLRAVSMSHFPSLSVSALMRLLQCFPQVTHLDLGDIYTTNTAIALAIANTLPNLRVLYLAHCRLSRAFLTTLVSTGESLEVLYMKGSVSINGAIENVLQNCAQIHTLHFTLAEFERNPQFSYMHSLITLVIDGYPRVKNELILALVSDIAKYCRKLQHLGLMLPSLESIDFTLFSAEALPYLRTLSLYDGQCKSLMPLYPSLRILRHSRPLLSVVWSDVAFSVEFRHFVDTIL